MNKVLLRAFTLVALTLVFATPFPNSLHAQCALDTEWTFDPPIPPGGAYSAGETIEICGEITFYQSNGANWIHGIELTLPDGYDLSSINVLDAPVACSNGGNWLYYETINCGGTTYGPGFFYDVNSGGPEDGNPCNNWGDPCFGNNANWAFCFEVTLDADCGGGGNPFDGGSIVPGITVYGDGDSGDWGIPTSCGSDDESFADVDVSMDCCDAESGTTPGTLLICENGPFVLFDELLDSPDPPGPPLPAEENGFWEYNGAPTTYDWDFMFDPTTDPPGEYTYNVFGTDNCVSSTTITMAFNDLGVVQSEAYCSGAPVSLSSLLDDPLPPGTWYDPSGAAVPGGTIDPADGPLAGDYTLEFYDSNNCFTTATLSLIFSTAGSGGVPTTYEFCSADGQICPLDVLDGNPAGGGSWGLVDADGNPVPPSYPSSDICFTVAELEALLPTPIEDGFAFRYILGAFPCFPPSVVTLTVEYNDPFDSGEFTQTSICVTDPPTDLTTLLEGTPDDGGVWSETGSGNVIPGGIFDPSTADPGDSFQFIYEGGLNPSLCFNGTILELTIIPADANAGADNTIDICEDDPSFFMLDSLAESAEGPPQSGGNWFGPAPGNAPFGQFFSPGNNTAGTYTYLISSTCDSDQAELTINVVPVQDPGLDGTLDICENETNVALIDGVGGTPDGGGTWSGGSATVDGNAVNDGDVFTYTVGVAPCERTAEVTINLIPAPSPGTDNTVTVCAGDASFNMVNELGGDAGGTWTGPSPITGDTYTPGTTDPGTYTYTVDPANCPAESAELTVNEVPDANAGNNNTTTVCESVGNINLTSLLGGTPDATGAWSDSGGGIANPYDVSGQCGTTLTLTYTVDNGTCSDVSTLNLTVECTPDAGPDDVLSFCGDGSTINLDDELPAGISGGTWSPSGTVTLDAANSGNYTYEISPVACNPDEAIYTLNIDPEIAISNVDAQCQPNQTEFVITFDISGGDGNYTPTLPAGVTGNIAGGTFTSDPIDLASNPSVPIEIEDGGPCGNQSVDVTAPNCVCPATAAFSNGNQTICLGESADLILDLDGTGPYTVEYDDGAGTDTELDLNDGEAITVSPAVTTTYTLESVQDANCVGSAAGTITITVDDPTDAGPDDVVELCGVGGNLALNTLLPAGTDPGTWANSTGNIPSGNITLNSTNSGNYTYTTTANACPSDQATYTLTIYDEISTSGLNVSCEANQTEYTIVFDISGGDGNYSFTSTPDAPDITGNIAGGTFTSDPIDVASVPNATITISDGGPCGDVDVNVNAPNCSCPVSGNFDTGNGLICLGESYDIVLNLTGGTDGDYNIEYSDGTNTFTPSGLSDQDVITVSPTTTTTYSFSSVSDSNCPGSANGSVTVTVEDPPNAGDDIELDFCGDGSNLNLISVLDGSADGNGSFNPANIVLLPANAGDYVYTEPGNACPDDQATYTINIEEELSFTAVSAVCEPNQTEYTVTFTITGGTPPYFVDGNAIGSDEFTETVDFDANPTYEFDITDNGECDGVTVSGTAPDCNCIAAGSISGSTTICEGDCATLTFDLVGDAPFSVVYENLNNGVTDTLNGISDGYTHSVCPAAETTYALVSVEDSYCEGVVTGGDVVVNVDTPVEVTDITETCDAINENYTVSFTVTGGDGTYNILPQFPVNGSFDDATGVYTTNPIPSGDGYSITVEGGECPEVVVENAAFDCGCISDAGSLDQTPLEVCDGESLSVTHFGDETLDGNDGFQFVLHDGDADNIGSVIATSPNGTFVFDYGSIVPGQSYFIAAVAGNTNGLGNVNLNHPCTSVSGGVEVVVNPLPTASISGSSVVCEGEPVNLIVSFTGEGNWDFTFAVNDNEDPDTITSTSDEYILTVTQPGTYTLTSISDNNCFGSTAGAVSVQNYDEPTATISGQNDVCEGSNDGPEVELTGNGPWDFVYAIDGEEQPPVTTSFPSNTLPVEQSGNYTLVSVNDANCDGVVSGNVNVNLIAQPTATITGGGTVCEGDEAEFNVQLTGTAPWTINYQIDGFNQTPLQTSDPNFSFMGGTEGDYVITTVQDDNCLGVVNTQASLVVNPTPTATYSSSATTFCDGEEIDLALNLEGVPPFHVTYVLNNDTITATGVQGGIFQTLTPESTVTAEVLFIEDGSNPTCSAVPDASIIIPQVELPNAPELTSDTICSSQDSLSIGVSPSPGLSYSWSPESNLSDPTVSNPIFSAEIFGVQPTTFTYVLTASNGNCEATDTMTVTVDPGPTARFVQTPEELNIDDPLVRFKNTSIARQGTFFFWEFDTLDTSEEYEPNFTFPEGIEGNYPVTLTAIDPLTGCLDTYMDVITVEPKMLIYVPNAFTPDGDGLNDLWGPVLTNIDEDDYRLTVYDRLGEIVFETRDPDKKWNGSMNGDGYYLKTDVYVWVIETKEQDGLEEITRRGRVTLVR